MAELTSQVNHSEGIFHGLPTYKSTTPKIAIITGANGISGFHTLRVLASAPERWCKIYALSRRPPPPRMMELLGSGKERVEHIACDFLEDPETIARSMKGKLANVDSIFFYSYLQPTPDPGAGVWSNAEKLVKVNSALLRNFLDGLSIANIKPRRFLLQTGAKNYGSHLGSPLIPQIESDPRVKLEPNFYYPQEDLLWKYCRDNPDVGWNVIRPAWIIGATSNAQMNIIYGLGLYAAVQSYLKKPLEFPGDLEAWENVHSHSSALLTGYQCEHAVLDEGMNNQAFNATDNSPFAWGRLWPHIAQWYGVTAGKPELDESKFSSITSNYTPPPRGWGPPTTSRSTFNLTTWAGEPENKNAWAEIVKQHNLDDSQKAFNHPEEVFPFLDGALWGGIKPNLSSMKSRKLGWHGFVDTYESIFVTLKEMSQISLLPPLSVGESGLPL